VKEEGEEDACSAHYASGTNRIKGKKRKERERGKRKLSSLHLLRGKGKINSFLIIS